MSIVPHTIDVVVYDMAKTLTFYRALGLDAPCGDENKPQVQIATPGGATLGFVTEALVKSINPDWVTPVGQRVTFACRCDTPEEVDAAYQRVIGAGYEGRQAPWDAFWGQRYAMVSDPDGNRVDLFAALTEAGQE